MKELGSVGFKFLTDEEISCAVAASSAAVPDCDDCGHSKKEKQSLDAKFQTLYQQSKRNMQKCRLMTEDM
eukprot:3580244-Ditylum_brightwellii.AAC.1